MKNIFFIYLRLKKDCENNKFTNINKKYEIKNKNKIINLL